MDPAADLAVVLAVASAYLDKVIAFDTAAFGEVGLSAEVRSVSQIVSRINEVERLGFKRCICPKNNLNNLRTLLKDTKVEIIGVESVRQALESL